MHNSRKISNVDSQNKMYEKSLAQFRTKMSHLEAKKSFFFSQSSPFAPLFTSNALSCCTNSKHLGPKLTHGKNDPYWANGNFFQKSELSQYCMQNFKNVPWVAGIDFL